MQTTGPMRWVRKTVVLILLETRFTKQGAEEGTGEEKYNTMIIYLPGYLGFTSRFFGLQWCI